MFTLLLGGCSGGGVAGPALLFVFMAMSTVGVTAHARGNLGTNCSTLPPPCNQLCKELSAPAPVKCSCVTGYTMSPDEQHCSPDEWASGAFVVFNHGPHLGIKPLGNDSLEHDSEEEAEYSEYALPPSVTSPTYLLKETDDIIGAIAFDIAEERIYFVKSRGRSERGDYPDIVQSVNFAGRSVTTFRTNGLRVIISLAVDWIGRVLYMADKDSHKIVACSIAGGHCHTVIKSEHTLYPSSLAVDSLNGKLYWSECGNPISQLFVNNLDGSGKQLLSGATGGCIDGLKLDFPRSTIYWVVKRTLETQDEQMTDSHSHAILESYDLNKRRKVVVPTGASDVVAVFSDTLLWSQSYESEDYRNLMITDVYTYDKFSLMPDVGKPFLHHLLFPPTHLHVLHGSLQPQGTNPCANVACSHICLLKSKVVHVCACPAGLKLHSDSVTCRDDWSSPSILLTRNNRILVINPDYVGANYTRRLFEADDVITALAYDWQTRTILFGVNSTKSGVDQSSEIRMLNLDNPISSDSLFVDIEGRVTDIEVDYLARNIYWVNEAKRSVEVGRLDGSSSRVVLNRLNGTGLSEQPVAIALDLSKRKLFYSDCGSAPHIGVCDLAGLSCSVQTRYRLEPGACANDLFYEASSETLIWSSTSNSTISHANVNHGSAPTVRSVNSPVSVAAGPDRMLWTSEHQSYVTYIDEAKDRQTHLNVGMHHLGRLAYFIEPTVNQAAKHVCSSNNGGCNNGEVCIPTGGSKFLCLSAATSSHPTVIFESEDAAVNTVEVEGKLRPIAAGEVTDEYEPRPSAPPTSCVCGNGGRCEASARGFSCRCSPGFSGDFCETNMASSGTNEPVEGDTINRSIFVGIGFVVLLLIASALFALACACKRRRMRREDVYDDEMKTLSNPHYEQSSTLKESPFVLPRPTVINVTTSY